MHRRQLLRAIPPQRHFPQRKPRLACADPCFLDCPQLNWVLEKMVVRRRAQTFGHAVARRGSMIARAGKLGVLGAVALMVLGSRASAGEVQGTCSPTATTNFRELAAFKNAAALCIKDTNVLGESNTDKNVVCDQATKKAYKVGFRGPTRAVARCLLALPLAIVVCAVPRGLMCPDGRLCVLTP